MRDKPATTGPATLESFIARAPVGLAFYDTDLRLAHANAALERMPAGAIEEHLRAVLATGEPVAGVELTAPPVELGAAPRRLRAAFFPVQADDGTLVGVGASVDDVSDRARSEAGLRLLSETGAALESSLHAGERLARVARLLVPGYAEACVVELLRRGRLHTAAAAHRDPRAEALLLASNGAGGLAGVVQRRTVERSDDHIAAPLVARGHILGALSLTRGAQDPRFDATDVAFVEELAARVALAVDNALLLERQTEIAQTLQASLLPPHLPRIPGLELAARYRAAGDGLEVGGDFYDAFPTRGGWTVTIGDACGKGATAAGVTALARHTIRALAHEARTPREVLLGVNDRLARQPDGDALLTAVMVKVEPNAPGMRVTVACAGHPPPYVVRAGGAVEELGLPGTLLGPFARQASFENVSTVLTERDALVLYTDGVTEARNAGRLFGETRLRDALADAAGTGANALASQVETALNDFGGVQSDDMALLVASAV